MEVNRSFGRLFAKLKIINDIISFCMGIGNTVVKIVDLLNANVILLSLNQEL